jgi:hypothetical protein
MTHTSVLGGSGHPGGTCAWRPNAMLPAALPAAWPGPAEAAEVDGGRRPEAQQAVGRAVPYNAIRARTMTSCLACVQGPLEVIGNPVSC